MAYVVTDRCIACRYTSCVVICPADCFHAGPSMLVIDPDECIDCGICVPECPAKAIQHESLPEGAAWLAFNVRHAQSWPVLTVKVEPLADADQRALETDKFPRLFVE